MAAKQKLTDPSLSDVNARIVEEAKRHFFANGFRQVTMDDIARQLGISKKTIYAHYPTKKALLEAVVEFKFAAMDSDLAQVTSGKPTHFTDQIHQLILTLQRHALEIQPAMIRDVQLVVPEVFRKIEVARRGMIQKHFGKLFTDGQRSGMIRRDIPAKLLVEILLAAVQGIMRPDRFVELGIEPSKAIISIVSVVLEGVITKRGRED